MIVSFMRRGRRSSVDKLSLFVILVLLVVTMTACGIGTSKAQQSLGASPAAGECNAPPLPPATPFFPNAMNSPTVASTTRQVLVPAVGTPASAAEQATLRQVAANFINCWNAKNWAGFVVIATPNFLLESYGTANRQDALALLRQYGPIFPQIRLLSIGQKQELSDGRLTAEVTFMFGPYQYRAVRGVAVKQGDRWLVDSLPPIAQPPAGTSTRIDVTVGESGMRPIVPDHDAAHPYPVIDLRFKNVDGQRHQLLMVRMPDGMAGTPIAAQPPAGTEFVGLIRLQPGSPDHPATNNLWLVNLGPGTYTLIDRNKATLFRVGSGAVPSTPAAIPVA